MIPVLGGGGNSSEGQVFVLNMNQQQLSLKAVCNPGWNAKNVSSQVTL